MEFMLLNRQEQLTGANYIPVDFSIDAGAIFSASVTSGAVYAEVQEVSSIAAIYRSSNIPVKVAATAPPPPSLTCPAPTAPSNLIVNLIANDQIQLNWQDNSSEEDHFEVRREKNGQHNLTIWLPASTTQYIDNRSLATNVAYTYVVSAKKTCSFWSSTNDAVVTVGCPNSVRIALGSVAEISLAQQVSGMSTVTVRNCRVNAGLTLVTAGMSITISPESTIGGTADFTARIESCTASASVSSADLITMSGKATAFVSPNPAEGRLTIRLEEGMEAGYQLRLMDDVGKNRIITTIPQGVLEFELDVSHLPKGFYYVRIVNQNNMTSIGMQQRVLLK